MKTSPAVYQVSDLVNEMQRLMETSYPEIWIEGELSSLSTPASGHLYFSLKDENSQLRCAMFRSRAAISKYKPIIGDLVRVRAKISIYPARGDLQCIVQHIESAGEGQLQRQFDELKKQLQQQGLFDTQSKQALPNFAKHIGIITSPTGAAIKDILSTLKRRCPGIPITVYPAIVQGEQASKSLIDAINKAVQHQQCDVLILSRGGGSLEDLWCFNDEGLAHTLFNCPLPVVSGVGHEVDITIADLVADYRAPTPTAAAEILSPDTEQLNRQLINLSLRLTNSLQRYLQQQGQNIDLLFKQITHPTQQLVNNHERLKLNSTRLYRAMQQNLMRQTTHVNQSQQQLRYLSPYKYLSQHKDKITDLANRLLLAQRQRMTIAHQQYKQSSATLHAVSPLATLDRGFSITRDANGAILRNASDCKTDDTINVQLKTGELECAVVKSTPNRR